MAVAAPELTPAPAVASDEPSPLATQALAPDANVPQPTQSTGGCGRARADTIPAVAGDEPSPLATEAPAPDANVPEPSEVSAAATEQAFEPAVAGEELSTQRWKSLRLA